MLSLFNLLASFYYHATRTFAPFLSISLYPCAVCYLFTFKFHFILWKVSSIHFLVRSPLHKRRCFIQTINNENVGNIMHYYGYALYVHVVILRTTTVVSLHFSIFFSRFYIIFIIIIICVKKSNSALLSCVMKEG